MVTTTRSHNVLKEQLKEFSRKSDAEYSAWYQDLEGEEKTFIDGRLQAQEAKKKADEDKLAAEGTSAATTDPPLAPTPQNVLPSEITEAEISEMWSIIDDADVSSLDQEALKIFEYQGFDPKAILVSLMKAKKKNKISDDMFKTDILTMCAIAIIKGSINSNNIKKISDEGQQEISRLETTYGIKRGSGRKEKPEVVTISRIGATFPGKIIQLICAGKVQSRTFMGPLSSSSLPAFMRHQAFAAIIPKSLKQKTKDFLLSLVTAFSVDQSIQINPNKKEKLEPAIIFINQSNFVAVTHNGQYPPEHLKIAIFKTMNFVYEDLMPTARRISAVMGDIVIPSRDEFNSDIATLE
jgi:hypothetical protein